MIIELPKKFNYGYRAKLVDGILKIPSGLIVREFMHRLTLAKKGKKCWYCGKELKKEDVTMDHLYPQDLGGPTITNNLAPSCSKCNNEKSNLTELQYKMLRECPEEERRALREAFMAQNEQRKIEYGFYLPSEWVCKKKITNILVPWYMDEDYKIKKYEKIEAFYKQYEKLPYPIVVDRNNYLLDGFLILIFAKNNNILQVPTIILENVEVVVNK